MWSANSLTHRQAYLLNQGLCNHRIWVMDIPGNIWCTCMWQACGRKVGFQKLRKSLFFMKMLWNLQSWEGVRSLLKWLFYHFLPFCLQEPQVYNEKGALKIVAVDTGIKFNQIRLLANRGACVKVVPWNYPLDSSGKHMIPFRLWAGHPCVKSSLWSTCVLVSI